MPSIATTREQLGTLLAFALEGDHEAAALARTEVRVAIDEAETVLGHILAALFATGEDDDALLASANAWADHLDFLEALAGDHES